MAVEYRAYAIGPEDRIVFRYDLKCADNDAARERARQLADSHTSLSYGGTESFWPGLSRRGKDTARLLVPAPVS